MNKENIQVLENEVMSHQQNIIGIIIQKDEDVIYEKYFNDYTKDIPIHIFSCTKSIVSLLIGIAIDQGKIKNVDQNILDFFPEYIPDSRNKIIQNVTIKDMMTMTVPYKFSLNPYVKYFTSDDWVKASLDRIGGFGKIGKFTYAPLIGPDILSAILVKTTDESVLDYANNNLFNKLGFNVEGTIQFNSKDDQMQWYNQKEKKGWVADPKGIHTAGWGLCLTTDNCIKLGQLIQNHGVYDGQQILSSQWIDQMTSIHSRWDKQQLDYGYLWWIIDAEKQIYAAIGDGGNVIYINNSNKLVVAITAQFKPRVLDRIDFIRKYIDK